MTKSEDQLKGERLQMMAALFQLDHQRAKLLRDLELTEATLVGMDAARKAAEAAEAAKPADTVPELSPA